MSETDAVIYLQTPDKSDQTVLHPGKWIAGTGKTRTARIQEQDLAIEVDQELLIYYELNNKFIRQAVRIDTVSKDEQHTVIGVEITGKPEIAERRQCNRVLTTTLKMFATLEGEANCQVLDVSAMGMGVLATKHHAKGETLKVEVEWEKSKYVGRVQVATVKELSKGQIRYGLLCVDNPKTNGELMKGLTKINLVVQRLHLRRMAQIS